MPTALGVFWQMTTTTLIMVTAIACHTVLMSIISHTTVNITKDPFGTHAHIMPWTYSVSDAATLATKCQSVSLITQAWPTGPSSSNGTTNVLSLSKPERRFAYGITSVEAALMLDPPMPNTTAHCVRMQGIWQAVAPKTSFMTILYKITTPYNPDGWSWALSDASLSNKYPTLINEIIYVHPSVILCPLPIH